MGKPWMLAMVYCVLTLSAAAQDVTIINHYGDTTGLAPDAEFFLEGSERHTVVINRFRPASSDETLRLKQLVASAVSLYLDEMTVVERNRLKLRKKSKHILRDLNAIVRDAVQYYHYRELHAFEGFSEDVVTAVKDLEALDLSQWEGPPDDATQTRFSMRQAWVQQHIDEIKLLANREMGLFTRQNLLVPGETITDELTASERDALLHEVRSFQTHDPLEPLHVELSDASVTLLASQEDFYLPQPARIPASDDSFEGRILALLESNNARMDALQDEVRALRGNASTSTADRALQAQIDDLRNVVEQLVADRSVATSTGEIIPNLPGDVTLLFASGATDLNGAGEFVVSEVIDLLARNPHLDVMVTGYADQTGSPAQNRLVASARAGAVKDALVSSGIGADRIVVNQFGDSKSSGTNASDRKAVITFLQHP